MEWASLSITISVATFLIVAIFVLEWCRRREMNKKTCVDWAAVEIPGVNNATRSRAIELVTSVIADCFAISPNQVSPNDDINRSFPGPELLASLTLDDPGEVILESIREKVELEFPNWDASACGALVSDLIVSVSWHMDNSSSATR